MPNSLFQKAKLKPGDEIWLDKDMLGWTFRTKMIHFITFSVTYELRVGNLKDNLITSKHRSDF